MTTHSGGTGAGEMYVVHYLRKDGTRASGRAEPDGHGRWSWLAPEDCAGIAEVEVISGGGGAAPGYGGGE